MQTGRKTRQIRVTVVAAAVLALSGTLLPAATADPEPSIHDVQERIADLHHQAEQASERFNTLRSQLGDARRELRALRTDAALQDRATEQLRSQVEQLVLAQVNGTGISTSSQLLVADDPDDFLASMAVMRSYSEQTSDLLVSYENARDELELRQEQAREQLAGIADAREEMTQEKAEIAEKADAAEQLLERLQAEAEASRAAAREDAADEAVASTTGSATGQAPAPTGEPVSGAAQVAVDTALAQVGDAYVYGAAGPDAFDCSGLTMYAWAAAGVSLSHSSSIQSGQGVPVSASDVQPGDLVFYYSPVSHVGMYIGDGMIVHAPNPSSTVEVVPMDLMPVAWIRRVG